MDYKNLQIAVDGGVARLTLCRPDRLNSFTRPMLVELRQALDWVDAQALRGSVRVLLLQAQGRAFCAGQDLRELAVPAGTDALTCPDLGAAMEQDYAPLILRLQALRVPSVARVQGVAAGAGVSLALACDLVLAAHGADFVLAFSQIGLVPDSGATWALPQRLGLARALGLALLSERMSAQQAADWGLIWRAVDDADLVSAADALARKLAALPTLALLRTRQAMHAAARHTLEQQLALEAGLLRELGASADYAEGVTAFLEKRTPQFVGA